MSNGLLNASGLTTPKVTTEEIILNGEPLSGSLSQGDFVTNIIQDGENVCRIYKSGWCEQYIRATISSVGVVNFIKPFLYKPFATVNTSYAPTNTSDDNNFVVNITFTSLTNCTIKYYDSDGGSGKEGEVSVIAKGFIDPDAIN